MNPERMVQLAMEVTDIIESDGMLSETQAKRFIDYVIGPQPMAPKRKRPRRVQKKLDKRASRMHYRLCSTLSHRACAVRMIPRSSPRRFADLVLAKEP